MFSVEPITHSYCVLLLSLPRARGRKIHFCTITAFFFFYICWEGAYGVLHVVFVLAVLYYFFFHFNVVVYHRLDPLFLCKETKADKSLSYSILHEEGTIRLPPVCGAIFFFFLS